MSGTQARRWLEAQPKKANGKVDIGLLIAESKHRGYCICPKPMRELIDFSGCICKWCTMPETPESYKFWHVEPEAGDDTPDLDR